MAEAEGIIVKSVPIKWIIGILDVQTHNISDSEITGIAFDSRQVAKGDIFFALEGERDGHDFVKDAIERGAVAAVVTKKIGDFPQIIVDDTLFSLGEIAKEYRKMFDIKVIGITGSVGKTTTREMIKQVLEPDFKVVASPANYNNLIGLPMTIFALEDDTEILVCELGINQSGEMERLVEIANPDIGVITRIAPVHLERLKSLENIAREKIKLFEAVSRNEGVCIYSLDDDLLDEIASPFHGYRTTFAVKKDADYYCDHTSINPNGLVSFRVDGNLIQLKIAGTHNVYNALAAYVVARHFDISGEIAARRLSDYSGFDKRMQIVKVDGITFIDDSYNANPSSVKAGISTLVLMNALRRVAILGDMLELGENAIDYHKEVLEYAYSAGIDEIILIGEMFKEAASTMQRESSICLTQTSVLTDKDEALQFIVEELRDGDLVLIKGSRKKGLDRIVKEYLNAKDNI